MENTGVVKIDIEGVEKVLIHRQKEFKRKLELGTIINNFMEKNELEKEALSTDELEALEIYENHGKKQNLVKTTWRGWQNELLRYLDQPSQRQVIWVIGKSGNEGKSFFQENVQAVYGYARVYTCDLVESPRNICYHLSKALTRKTDIFLFNITKNGGMNHENYKFLESIKDGRVLSAKYNSKRLEFKKPNIVIVFANEYPKTAELSKDRWQILKISNDHEKLENVTKENV